MLRPHDKLLVIPEVPAEIIHYMDQLIDIMNEHGISEKMMDAFMKINIGFRK